MKKKYDIKKIKALVIAYGVPSLVLGIVFYMIKIPIIHRAGYAMIVAGALGLALGVVLAKMTERPNKQSTEKTIIDIRKDERY